MFKKKLNLEEIKIEAWTQELNKTLSYIIYDYKLKVSLLPEILIKDLKSIWGSWDKSKNQIVITYDLIARYPWSIVSEVLKHELAHFIVDLRNLNPANIHGPEFVRICHELGMKNWAMNREVDIVKVSQTWQNEENIFNDKMLNRVEKLLNLAASSENEFETENAMKKVRFILTRYNIQYLDESGFKNYHSIQICNNKKRLENYEYKICSILQEFYFVEVIFSWEYNANSFEKYRAIEILGLKKNVILAEYIYHFLLSALDSLWLRFKKDKTSEHRLHKRSFVLGLLNGFHKKMKKINTEYIVENENIASSTALVHLKLAHDKLNQYVNMRFPRIAGLKTAPPKINTESYKKGTYEGAKISIKKPISKSVFGGFLN